MYQESDNEFERGQIVEVVEGKSLGYAIIVWRSFEPGWNSSLYTVCLVGSDVGFKVEKKNLRVVDELVEMVVRATYDTFE